MTTQKERFAAMLDKYKRENTQSPETAINAFISLLDYTEESDSGRVFHPTTIGSCRIVEGAKMGVILDYFRSLKEEK